MTKLNYVSVKSEIAEIVEIVKAVPEALQQRCFELLFEVAFKDSASAPKGRRK